MPEDGLTVVLQSRAGESRRGVVQYNDAPFESSYMRAGVTETPFALSQTQPPTQGQCPAVETGDDSVG